MSPRTTAPAGASAMERRILRAARRRIETFGYRRTSMAEVARDAGIAVGTVYVARDRVREDTTAPAGSRRRGLARE